MSYESHTGILFSADAFGAFGALDGRIFNDEDVVSESWYGEARRYYANIVGKYGLQVQGALSKASAFDIKMIAPLHGPVWRSNLGDLHVGDKVNIERAMPMGGRLDGHIVQGHVDTTAECIAVEPADGSHVFTFRYAVAPELIRRGYFTVDKGSVTVNGVSLTVCTPTADTFSVCIIPYTLTHTNFCDIHVGTKVNLEFDILGKYIARLQELTAK